jgi:tetratricopeptide (TPR) repeat protein
MARADRRSAQRASRAAANRGGIRASGQATAVEQTLFFTKIRKRAKWVFVFLALAFAIGFVVFGVGTSGGGGIGDILQGRSSGPSGPSVDSAQKKVDANPKDPAALRELATALQNDGRTDDAIPILERYSQVRPQDSDALNELATLYQAKAARFRGQAQLAQLQVQNAAPETQILPPATTPLGKALGDLPISAAVSGAAQAQFNDKLTAMQGAYQQAQRIYERIVVLKPDDASPQRELGYSAVYAGDNTTAIAAFKRFLQLAPDDAEAPIIKQQLKQLQQPASATPSTTG